MSKFIYIFLIALSGCIADSSTLAATDTATPTETQQSSSLTNEELSTVVEINVEQVITYQNLTLRLIAVEDSRCATGVTCIWAGQLVVTLEVSNDLGEQQEVKLIRKREPEEATAFGYSLLLLDVEPHPKEGKVIQASDQIVKLQMQKN